MLLAQPLDIRARRFRAVFVCGLQDGEFPRRPRPEPFLSDEDRRGLAMAAGLRLPFHEDVLDRERSLFYAAVSRPEDVLFLSWRSSDEEGDPLAPSAFLDDVRALFTDELWEQRGTRLLADVTWAPRDAPTPHELRRAYAAAEERPEPAPLTAPASTAVLGLLAARETEPARGLEAFAACGTRWLIEQFLRPGRTEPDPEPMQRGSLAHGVLERTLALLRERTGSARIAPERLELALSCLADALAERGRGPLGPESARTRALLRSPRGRPGALPADRGGVRRRLRAHRAGMVVRAPRRPARPAAARRRRRVRDRPRGPRGRRPRRHRDRARLQGPHGRSAAPSGPTSCSCRSRSTCSPPASCWGSSRSPGSTSRSRAASSPPAGSSATTCRAATRAPTSSTPTRSTATLEEARELAVRTAGDLRAGRLRPCPERCSSRGCRYPGICRAGEPTVELPA